MEDCVVVVPTRAKREEVLRGARYATTFQLELDVAHRSVQRHTHHENKVRMRLLGQARAGATRLRAARVKETRPGSSRRALLVKVDTRATLSLQTPRCVAFAL